MLASSNSGSFRLELTELELGQYSSPSITTVSACWLKTTLLTYTVRRRSYVGLSQNAQPVSAYNVLSASCLVPPAILSLKISARRQLFRPASDPLARNSLLPSVVPSRQPPRPPPTRIPRNKKAVRRRSNAALPLSG